VAADICGWVETRKAEDGLWDGAFRVHDIVYRQYDTFAGLFGVRNGDLGNAIEVGHFRAVACGRGAPPKASRWYRQERDEYGDTGGET
jgi:hypothetical protein